MYFIVSEELSKHTKDEFVLLFRDVIYVYFIVDEELSKHTKGELLLLVVLLFKTFVLQWELFLLWVVYRCLPDNLGGGGGGRGGGERPRERGGEVRGYEIVEVYVHACGCRGVEGIE